MIVVVNGCFDLIAPHHVRFLERAKLFGDRLIVALNSDRWIREHKGPPRPFYCEEDRKLIVGSLRVVDEVTVFDTEEELADLIKSIQPDWLVKGEEYRNRQVTGAEYAKRIVFLHGTFVGGITETIVKRIRGE